MATLFCECCWRRRKTIINLVLGFLSAKVALSLSPPKVNELSFASSPSSNSQSNIHTKGRKRKIRSGSPPLAIFGDLWQPCGNRCQLENFPRLSQIYDIVHRKKIMGKFCLFFLPRQNFGPSLWQHWSQSGKSGRTKDEERCYRLHLGEMIHSLFFSFFLQTSPKEHWNK